MRFYLGTHRPHWLGQLDVPLFVSRRTLCKRSSLPVARGRWVLDSGGFTELNQPPYSWTITTAEYAAEVLRYRDEIGNLDWAAPMDWMCEPSVLAKTGLSVAEHQRRTIESFRDLRQRLGGLVVPVIQGWEVGDYAQHVEAYEHAGVYLLAEPVVAIGSVCRRGQDVQIKAVVRSLARMGLLLHAFGVRGTALFDLSDSLVSADSMAWSFNARRARALPGCRHRHCTNCQRYAVAWYQRMHEMLGQLRIEGTEA